MANPSQVLKNVGASTKRPTAEVSIVDANGDPVSTPGNATTSTAGLVKQAAHMANVSDAPTADDFNGLLAALQAAGIMAAS